MRFAAFLMGLMLLAGCAGGSSNSGGRLSKVQYLSALQSVPAPMRTASTNAPMVGLVVSGTLTNDGTAPLRCSAGAFVLVDSHGSDVAPSGQFCQLPVVAPQQSTYFNATFPAPPRDGWQLRFDHGDGSYELHDLVVPPAG